MTWRQYAALPWRQSGAATEVLLITSRETKRWVIPKGWPIHRLAPHNAAALEAYEEAGVTGTVATTPVGTYEYEKRRKSGTVRPCRVTVFALAVAKQHEKWPERGQRTAQWMPIEEAASLVMEPKLQEILRQFSPS